MTLKCKVGDKVRIWKSSKNRRNGSFIVCIRTVAKHAKHREIHTKLWIIISGQNWNFQIYISNKKIFFLKKKKSFTYFTNNYLLDKAHSCESLKMVNIKIAVFPNKITSVCQPLKFGTCVKIFQN